MVQKLAQVALAVTDLDRAVAFYRDRLGLTFLFQDAAIALLAIGETRLLLGREGQIGGAILYYAVMDIEARFQELKDTGTLVVDEPRLLTKFQDKEIWMAFLKDPDGNTLALVEER